MSRSFVRTAVLDVSAFAADVKIDEFASKICACFEEGEVVSVQFMPAKSVRVTISSEALKRLVLKTVLSQYGVVHDVHYRASVHLSGAMDGSRVVHMMRLGPIPRTNLINGLECKAWYHGMPVTCDICEGSHKAQDCPFKGKCMRCHQPGHYQLFCPNPRNTSYRCR